MLLHNRGPSASTRPQHHHNCPWSGARRVVIRGTAQRRHAASNNFYELLGVGSDASDEDIKAAFRRKARETHPDVNSDEDAEQQFMECKEAYETLSDADRRREYDRINRLGRRVGFFQDVVDDPGPSRTSPFRWSRVGAEPGPDPRYRRTSWERRERERYGDGDEEGDEDEDEDGGNGLGEDGGSGRGGDGDVDGEQRLRELFRFMQGNAGGGLRQWQSGGNPWGTSTSDLWRRQVDQQSRDPFSGRGPGFRGRGGAERFPPGTNWTPPGRGGEWDDDPTLTRRQGGWAPPGRGQEWRPPGRGDLDESDERPPRGPGPGRRGGGDDFRGKPL